MSRKRYDDTQQRIDQIIAAAVSLSEDFGYANITRDQVAEAAGCSPALVSRHMGSMDELRTAVVTEAVAQKNLNILAQALIERHPIAVAAPQELRRKAALSIQ